MESYIGKIVKISQVVDDSRVISNVGIVYKQEEQFYYSNNIRRDGGVKLSYIKPNGEFSYSVVKLDDGTSITSTKIDPDLRVALKEAYKQKVKLDAFESKLRAELDLLKSQMDEKLKDVKLSSRELTSNEFANKITALFRDKYPSSGGYYSKYFDISSYSPTEVTMVQVQDIEKYATPESYCFLYREYDDTMNMKYHSSEYKSFAENNAPRLIPELAKHCKSEVRASLGDKNWLMAERTYTFPIKFGFSERSLDEIRERLFGERVRQKDAISLDKQISKANANKREFKGNTNKNIYKER